MTKSVVICQSIAFIKFHLTCILNAIGVRSPTYKGKSSITLPNKYVVTANKDNIPSVIQVSLPSVYAHPHQRNHFISNLLCLISITTLMCYASISTYLSSNRWYPKNQYTLNTVFVLPATVRCRFHNLTNLILFSRAPRPMISNPK